MTIDPIKTICDTKIMRELKKKLKRYERYKNRYEQTTNGQIKDAITAVFTKKPFPPSDMAKKMESQSQWGKICTGDFHHPQKDVPTSNLERPEDPASREYLENI